MGHVAPGIEMMIVHEQNGSQCGPNETGEIWVRTHAEMKGYLNRPEEDSKVLAGDGWIRTGDLGHYDEEYVLYFDGRLKELIKYKNKHVYPTEVRRRVSE